MAVTDEQPKSAPARNPKLETDLKKLRRVDLLELLVDQVREGEERAAAMAELEQLVERQRAQIEAKDDQIGRLIRRLDEQDAQIAKLREQNDIYARSVDVLDVRGLAAFQERAMIEYLSRIAPQ